MIARVSLASGSLEEAERLARQVAPEMLNRGDLRYLLGVLMLAKGELDAAERAFSAVREKLPREGWGEWAWPRWRWRAATMRPRSGCSVKRSRCSGRTRKGGVRAPLLPRALAAP